MATTLEQPATKHLTSPDGVYTACQLKEMAVKYMKEAPILGFGQHDQTGSLEKLSMLNVDELDMFSPLHNITQSLGDVLKHYDAHNQELKNMVKTLKSYLSSPGSGAMAEAVCKWLDEDMKELGISNPDRDNHESWLKKATRVARELIERETGVKDKQVIKKTNYCMKLVTLLGGDPELLKGQPLWFDVTMPFSQFEKLLKELTKKSTIPPCQKKHPRMDWPDMFWPDLDEEYFDEITDTEFPNIKELIEAAKKRDPEDEGYSLADGPWMYRLPALDDTKPKPGWEFINNENDYRNMAQKIWEASKEVRKSSPDGYISIVFQHSLDGECLERHLYRKAEEREYNRLEGIKLREIGFYSPGSPKSTDGESWWDYHKRQMEKEEEEEMRPYREAEEERRATGRPRGLSDLAKEWTQRREDYLLPKNLEQEARVGESEEVAGESPGERDTEMEDDLFGESHAERQTWEEMEEALAAPFPEWPVEEEL